MYHLINEFICFIIFYMTLEIDFTHREKNKIYKLSNFFKFCCAIFAFEQRSCHIWDTDQLNVKNYNTILYYL